MQKSRSARAQLNVNPALAKTWFVGVTIYCTFFNNNFPPLGQFLCNKILLKKTSYSRGTLIEQNFELKGPGRLYTPITGCFHHKTIISMENFRVNCYSLLKNCSRQCTLLPFRGIARDGGTRCGITRCHPVSVQK